MHIVVQKFPNGWSYEVQDDQVRVWNGKGLCIDLEQNGDAVVGTDHKIQTVKGDSQNMIIR